MWLIDETDTESIETNKGVTQAIHRAKIDNYYHELLCIRLGKDWFANLINYTWKSSVCLKPI